MNSATQDVVEKVKNLINEHDKLISLFGMKIEKVAPGSAVVSMKVKEEHLNAARLCHGATIYALADVAFALACNSHGRQALALEVGLNYLRPAKLGEELRAVAEEENLGNTTGVYCIRVFNQEGKKVAFLKATAYRFERSL